MGIEHIEHEAIMLGDVAGTTTGGSEVEPAKSGTLETPAGPITWTRGADGTLNAEGGGQQLTITETDESDGSWQKNAVFSEAGANPYLTIRTVALMAEWSAATTLKGGQSQLTLTITDIDTAATSGTATVSGTLDGSAVNWTGPVDLTANPLAGKTIPGWPHGSFAGELQKAAFFNPLAKELISQTTATPPPGDTMPGSGHGRVIEDDRGAGAVIGRAAAGCFGGAVAGSAGGPETLGLSMLLGCGGGIAVSVFTDIVNWWNSGNVPMDPPVLDPPPIEEQTSTKSSITSQDDPPPPPPPAGSDPPPDSDQALPVSDPTGDPDGGDPPPDSGPTSGPSSGDDDGGSGSGGGGSMSDNDPGLQQD